MAVAIDDAQSSGRETLFRPIPDSPQEEALQSSADITIFGGANGGAKTATLVAAGGRGVYHGDPGWTAAIFRRTYPELTQLGGVVDQSKKFYPNASERYNKNERKYEYPFGARVKFSHLQYEEDKEAWDGAELAFVGFDQLESFTRSQFTYLLGRLRCPDSKFQPHCFATCNPTAKSHWLYEFLEWWFDDDGYPDPDKAGVTRYYHRRDDEFVWVDGPDVLSEDGLEPMSVKFIPATVDDNPHVSDNYQRQLASLDDIDRQRKRFGRWGVTRDDSPLSGHAIQFVDEVPDDAGIPVRYWDLADTDESADGADQASHTAGVRGVGLRRLWTECQYSDIEAKESCSFWCAGKPDDETCPSCGNEKLDTRQRPVLLATDADWFQLEADDKENRICANASRDGYGTHIGFEQEPGQSGKDNVRKWKTRLLSDYEVEGDRPTGEKRDRMKLWIPMAKRGRFWVLDTPRMKQYVDALVDMEPKDVPDATSGLAKMALDEDRIDGPGEMFFL